MVFQPPPPYKTSFKNPWKGSRLTQDPVKTGDSVVDVSGSLVDEISKAVKRKLLEQGLPPTDLTQNLPRSTSAQGFSVPPGSDRLTQSFAASGAGGVRAGDLASKIDHTLLKPDATDADFKKVCEEARQYNFATVCVNSSHVARVAELLRGSPVLPIAVVGFPLGAASSASKAFEASEAVRNGAREIDMVINIGALKSRDYAMVLSDIAAVVEASKPYPVKVILETSSLTHEEKIIACALSKAAEAAYVKTSTGFGSGGATVEDILLMRKVVGPEMGVKASGGVRTFEDAQKMLAAGATRLGASSSVAIVTQQGGQSGGAPGSKY